jgi:hypothetical protein
VIFGRRYADTIRRQLDLFAGDHAELLAEADVALRAYDAAPRDEAEERYAVYDDLIDTGRELLAELRDGFAGSLDENTADEYRAAFDRAAAKRFGRLAAGLEDI